MSNQLTLPQLAQENLEHLKANWGWLVALGVVLIVVGMSAVSMAFVATLATMVVLGVLTLLGAGAEIASAVWARRWQGCVLHLLCGVLYAVFGFLIMTRPVPIAAALTLVMAALFLIGGLLRIVIALAVRFHNWGWSLLNGLVTFALGLMIWQEWPESSLWVIGTFVGIDLILSGWSWVVLGLSVRRFGSSTTPA